MRNFIFILILVFSISLLMSCESTTNMPITEESYITDTIDNKINELAAHGIIIKKGVFISNGGLVDVNIEYPQIERDDDNILLRDIINKQLYEIAIMDEMRNWSDVTIYSEITYEITFLNDKYLCCVCQVKNTAMGHEKIQQLSTPKV